jgi:hypothetical protein
MRHELLQFFHERLLGQLNGFIEPSRDPFALLPVDFRAELGQIIRWFYRGKIMCHAEQALQAQRVVGRVVQ